MKYLISLIFLTGTFLYSQEIEINRIKFLINDVEFIWDVENSIDKELNPSGTEPRFLASFFRYKPGTKIELKKLEKELDEFRFRLIDSGLFYSQQISIVPPRKYPDKRTIVVKVTDGFKYRFGGGYAYGFFGNMNLFGRGDYILLAGGLNKVLVDYRHRETNNFFWGNKFFANPQDQYGYNSLYGGYNITPDISVILDVKANYHGEFFPSSGVAINLKKNIIMGDHRIKYNFNTYGKMVYLNNIFTPNYLLSMDTRYIPPIPMSLQVRGDWNYLKSELFVGSYIYYHFKTISFPPVNLKFSPFAFWEVIDTKIGLGLEIYFDVPIFTMFTLSYGWNLEGQGSFEFR